MQKKFTSYHVCLIAFAICLNLIGAQIALVLRLPIYLDSIGTMLIGAILGPFYGAFPNLLSGLILGMTSDIYSLYYAPIGILLGILTGIVFRYKKENSLWIFLAAFLITLPTTILSSIITVQLFGGITSSGSTYLVTLLSKTKLGLTLSCFIVQFLTEYLDRVVGLFITLQILKKVPLKYRKN